jgi:hypothetical protein
MKLFNIFKKEKTKVVNSNIQSLDKKQLEKVIGGGGGTSITNVPTGKWNGPALNA